MKKFTARRIAGLALAGALMVGLLAGCGDSSSSNTTTSTNDSNSSTSTNDNTSTTPADDGKVYRLSVTFHDSPEAEKTKYVQGWADALNEASGGRLEVTVYAGGTLAASTEALDAVKNGTVDIGVCFSGFFPGQFPLSDVITMPLAGMDDAVQATNVLWDLWETYPEMQAEYENYKVIMLYAGPNNIICTSKPVNVLSDMAGLKLRAAAGTATDMSTNWGATPMTISSSEIYQSMEKSVIDGYIIDWTGVSSWSLFEVTNYFVELPFFTQAWAVLMNQDSYNALPEDLQALIDEYSSRDWSLGFAENQENEAAGARDTAQNEYGSTVIVPDADEIATFQPAADAYIQQWIDKISADGFDGQGFYDKALELAAQYE